MAELNENDVLQSTLNIIYAKVEERKVVLHKIQQLKDFANDVKENTQDNRSIKLDDEEVLRLAMIGADFEIDRLIKYANLLNERIGPLINIPEN